MGLRIGRPTGRTEEHIEKVKSKIIIDDDPEMRLNVRMPKSEYKKLKQFALDQDETISDVVRHSLREYMSK